MEIFHNVRVRVSLVAGLLCGLFTHMFFLTNVLKNYDGVIQNGFGAGVTSGRWLLEWVGSYIKMLWGDYNIPWYGGILTIILLSISATLIVAIFDFHNRWMWILCPVLFMTFPTTASTLVFSNTSLFYAFAILLIVFGCYAETKWKYGWILAIFFAACSMGIYQAYFPIMISIYLLLVIAKLLDNEETVSVVITGCKYLGEIIASVVLYFLLLQYRLHHTGKTLSNYQGINEMGRSGIRNIWDSIKSAYIVFFATLNGDYASLSNTLVIRLMRFAVLAVSIFLLICAISITIKRKDVLRAILLLVSSLLLPLAYGSIHVMCPNSAIYTLMVYGQVFFYFFPIILIGALGKEFGTKHHIEKICHSVIIVVLLISCLNFMYQINGAYTNMYYAGEQAKSYFGRMITRVQESTGFSTDKNWVFLGNEIHDPLYVNPWSKQEFLIGGVGSDMINIWSRTEYIEQYLGIHIPYASSEEVEEVRLHLDLKQIPCYPNQGSIVITDKNVIIRLE